MLKIGNYNQLRIGRRSEPGLYLTYGEGELLLPNKYIPDDYEIGDTIEVFVYTDSEDRLVATTLKPFGTVGEFVALKVKEVNNIGAFLDWGLEKDLLLPHKEQNRRLKPGDTCVVKIFLDVRSERVIGVGKIGAFLKDDVSELKEGEKVSVMAYELTPLGVNVIINNEFLGLVYQNEVYDSFNIGDVKLGYIKKIREDGKIDVSLELLGYQAVKESDYVVLEALREAGGFLAYGDHSHPDDIRDKFKMSKKAFKKIIGSLYKEGKITIEESGIRLNK